MTKAIIKLICDGILILRSVIYLFVSIAFDLSSPMLEKDNFIENVYIVVS